VADRIDGARLLAALLALLALALRPPEPPLPRLADDDQPATVEPLDRLTPISPNAPSGAPLREALAA
jgi:hypothetical protein